MTTMSTDGLKQPFTGGSGARFGHLAIILAGVASLFSTFLTLLSVWMQSKHCTSTSLRASIHPARSILPQPQSFTPHHATESTLLTPNSDTKPLLQRYVVRILIMVPIFSAASLASLVSLRVAFWIDPFKDVYEAFVIYAFTVSPVPLYPVLTR